MVQNNKKKQLNKLEKKSTYNELFQKARFQSVPIAALCLYNIQRENLVFKNLSVLRIGPDCCNQPGFLTRSFDPEMCKAQNFICKARSCMRNPGCLTKAGIFFLKPGIWIILCFTAIQGHKVLTERVFYKTIFCCCTAPLRFLV